MATRIIDRGDNAAQYYDKATGVAVDLYDLMLHSTNTVVPADGAETAPAFAGVAAEAAVADDPATEDFHVLRDVEVEISCTSSTWEVGDLVAIAGPNSVAKTAVAADAVGYCTRRSGTAATTVRARLTSTVTPN